MTKSFFRNHLRQVTLIDTATGVQPVTNTKAHDMPERIATKVAADRYFQEHSNEYQGRNNAFEYVIQSIVEYDPALHEEIFLSYTEDLEGGPGLIRTGYSPPAMRRVDMPWEMTTNSIEQRRGTWFIDEEAKQHAIQLVEAELAESASNPGDDERTLRYCLDDFNTLPSHLERFKANYGDDIKVVGQQSLGDLSMNLWYVAYVDSLQTNGVPVFIFLPTEPIADRTYVCLVKWKPEGDHPHCRVSIEPRVRFNTFGSEKDQGVWVDGVRADSRIEFAVSGKEIIREGHVVDLPAVVNQFSDLRHLLVLPNLNPNGVLASQDGGRPRYYYGRLWHDDVWFGEAQLLEDNNLQRAALVLPVLLNRIFRGMGASEDQVRAAMKLAGYKEISDTAAEICERGEWRFVAGDPNLVEIFFKLNTYGASMIGVDESGKIYSFASSGHQGRSGSTIKDSAQFFINEVAEQGSTLQRALIFDEGNDVFQRALFDDAMVDTVPYRRLQVRASFIFGRRQSS